MFFIINCIPLLTDPLEFFSERVSLSEGVTGPPRETMLSHDFGTSFGREVSKKGFPE